jgi:hypothetical protein
MKIATCNFLQVAIQWRRRELNPRPVMLGNEPLRVYSIDYVTARDSLDKAS